MVLEHVRLIFIRKRCFTVRHFAAAGDLLELLLGQLREFFVQGFDFLFNLLSILLWFSWKNPLCIIFYYLSFNT